MAEEDLLFGKNRHLFGGMEPSDMLKFAFNLLNTDVGVRLRIDATPPGDTIVDGQTLCTVAGALIIKNDKHRPQDEFDGEVFADISSASTLVDSNIVWGNTYYYAAFPYTTQGVYNRNPKFILAHNEPSNLRMLSATVESNPISTFRMARQTNNKCVRLSFQIPDDIESLTIRRNITGYPETENDGTPIAVIKSTGDTSIKEYIDSDVIIGNTYYYSVFPRSTSGAYNRNPENRIKVTIREYTYYYGYDIDLSDPNPNTKIKYPRDVDNNKFVPVAMDGETLIYNDWNIKPGEKFMPRPCMLRYDGTVAYYLNPNDYSKRIDGSPSDVANINFPGNAMMEWPKIYTKRWKENGVYHFRCCDLKLDDAYDCCCNHASDNTEHDHFYIGIYPGCLYNEKIRSLSGYEEVTSQTFNDRERYIKNNGPNYDGFKLHIKTLLTDLLFMFTKTVSCDNNIGNKLYGMEKFLGNKWIELVDLRSVNGEFVIKSTSANNYIHTGLKIETNGYISDMELINNCCLLPKTPLNGSSTTGMCGFISGYSDSKTRIVTFGNNSEISINNYEISVEENAVTSNISTMITYI